MSEPFKMKGSSALGYGNQHSKGAAPKMYDSPTDFNAKLRAADLPEGKFKDAVDASGKGMPYASPTKAETTKSKATKKKNKEKTDIKTKKTELNQFGETPEQYNARMKADGFQNVKSND